MTPELLDLAVRTAVLPVAGGILAIGAEETAMDLQYFLRRLNRREQRKITMEELEAAPPRRIAVMVAAWHEASVIDEMLEHNLRDIDYDRSRYDFFCGTYQNDPETQACVDEVSRRHDNVHKVVVPHDGPTSKADCLNWVYQGIVLEERRRGERFDILLMHDAEDVIHPLSLRLYSLLIPEHDFVQTPVFSLDLRRRSLIGGTYIDEFSEHHLKEMQVRESIGGLVPSAGVGSAFARDAFEDIALANQQNPFNIDSLTEDYEIGLKLRLAGKKVHFACRSLQRTVEVPRRILRGTRTAVKEEYIATREYFPHNLRASVRQRSRWITGIALQAWRQIGWAGGAAVRYCLWRDRKALLTNALLLAAYLFIAYAGGRAAIAALQGSEWSLSSLVPPHSALWWMMSFNLGLVAWRLAMKMIFVGRLYGLGHALISAPRLILANLISLAATSRAVAIYLHHLVTGAPLRWAKTDHAFPSVELLQAQRRRLGEFLVDRQALSAADLDEALHLQRETHLRLGEVIAASGMMTPREIARAVGEQLELPYLEPAPYDIPLPLLRALPEAVAAELDAVPFAFESGGRVRVVMARPPEPDERERLAELLDASPVFALADADAIRAARWKAYRRLLEEAPPRERLGQALLERGLIDAPTLAAVLDEQLETGEHLGELLVARGLLDARQVSEAIAAPHPPYRSVSAGDIEIGALRELGCGMATFYQLAPLAGSRPGRIELASPFRIHPEVLAEAGRRIGSFVLEPVLAPALEVRVALALASGDAWPGGADAGKTYLDGEELDALFAEPGLGGDAADVARVAALLEVSPIDLLESWGRINPVRAAELRARALGLSVATAPALLRPPGEPAVIPPELATRHHIQVLHLAPGALSLASPRPTPLLANRIANLFDDRAVAWSVVPAAAVSARLVPPANPAHVEVSQ